MVALVERWVFFALSWGVRLVVGWGLIFRCGGVMLDFEICRSLWVFVVILILGLEFRCIFVCFLFVFWVSKAWGFFF